MSSRPVKPRSVFGYRDFRLFFVGNLVSGSGTWLQNVAQAVLVLQLTRRSTDVGIVQAATFLPVLLLALHGGSLADRFDRRRLLIWTQLAAAAATAALAVVAATGHATFAIITAVGLVLGVQYAVATPAGQAFVPALVPREELGQAIGLNSVTYNVARVVGPVLATASIALLGFDLAFGLNSLSFVALALAILAIRPPPQRRAVGGASIREGIRHAWRNPRIRAFLAMMAAVSFAIDPVYTLSPAFARFRFHRGASAAGILISAFGAGAIVAAFTLRRALRIRGAARRAVGLVGAVVMAAGLAGLALSRSLAFGVGALLVAGVGYLLTTTVWTTGIHEEVQEAFRGRVMAIWTLCFLGSRPISAVLDGVLADLLSARVAALLMLVPLILAGAALLSAPAAPAVSVGDGRDGRLDGRAAREPGVVPPAPCRSP